MKEFNLIKAVSENRNEITKEQLEFLKGFAHRIENNLSRYGRITGSVIVEAKMKGIVIVHAEDDELIHFHGAVNQQVASTMLNTCEQEIKLDRDGIALDSSEESYSAIVKCYRYSFDWSYLFKITDNIEYIPFRHITKDGVKWCQGIVFYIDELYQRFTVEVDDKTSFGSVVNRSDIEREKILVIENKRNNRNIEFALESEYKSPLVIYNGKTYKLPWLDILGLAMKSSLFAESELNVEEVKKNGES